MIWEDFEGGKLPRTCTAYRSTQWKCAKCGSAVRIVEDQLAPEMFIVCDKCCDFETFYLGGRGVF